MDRGIKAVFPHSGLWEGGLLTCIPPNEHLQDVSSSMKPRIFLFLCPEWLHPPITPKVLEVTVHRSSLGCFCVVYDLFFPFNLQLTMRPFSATQEEARWFKNLENYIRSK